MSRIDDLIAKLCPNGVEYKTLGDICNIETGKLNANDAVENGAFMFFTTAKKPSKIDKYRWDTEALLISGNANVGEVKHYIGKFDAYQRTYVLTNFISNLNVRFLFFILSSYLKKYLEDRTNSAAMTYIVLATLKNFPIPIPPLEIQREIVKVLDTFTKLEAELEAELEARRRQYHYYRDQLLNFEGRDDVQWMVLGEVITNLRTGLNPRQNFVLNPRDAKNYYITVRELGGLRIVLSDKTDKINDDALKIINNRSKLRTGDVLFSGTGTIGNTALIECAPSNWNIKEGVYALTPNIRKIISKFLLYLLNTTYVLSQINSYSAGSTVVSISMANFKRVIIPVPSLEEQTRIVAILEKFDALVNDLSSGLPAEISARRKQYAYYRDRLLTFKEAQ